MPAKPKFLDSLVLLAVFALVLLVFFSGCIKPVDGNGGNGDDNTVENPTDENEFVEQPGPEPTPATLQQQINACLTFESEGLADSCLVDVGLSLMDSTPCEYVRVLPKDSCYQEIAINAKNVADCDKIVESDLANQCYESLGIELRDYVACSKIVGDEAKKDNCLKEVASAVNDFEVCSRISVASLKDECLTQVATATGNTNACEGVSGAFVQGTYLRDDCYLSAAGEAVSIELCNKLLSEEKSIECFELVISGELEQLDTCSSISLQEKKDSCIKAYALNTKEFSACSEISAQELQQECYESIARTSSATEELCGLVEDDLIVSQCFTQIALNELDVEVCNKINLRRDKNDCVAKVAVTSKDSDKCLFIVADPGKRNECISDVAVANLSTGQCKEIENSGQYTIQCYSGIAVALNTLSVCDSIEVKKYSTEKYESTPTCYKQFAVATEDANVCELIDENALYYECKNDVRVVVECIDGDGSCQGFCWYAIDKDCEKPGYCGLAEECDDGLVGTENKCEENACVFVAITQCSNGDDFCPDICSIEDDTDCVVSEPGQGLVIDSVSFDPAAPVYPFTEVLSMQLRNASTNTITEFHYDVSIVGPNYKATGSDSISLGRGETYELRLENFLPSFNCTNGYDGGGNYTIKAQIDLDGFGTGAGLSDEWEGSFAFSGDCPT